jgi:site-specific recombinase XerC
MTARCTSAGVVAAGSSGMPGGPLRLDNWRRRVFDPACKALGLTDVSPHDLRHTAASLAIQRGANVKTVRRMLGHASAAMTLGGCAALFSDALDSVAVALDPRVPQMCPTGSFRPPETVPSEQLNLF